MIVTRMTHRRIAELHRLLSWALTTQHVYWRQREIAKADRDTDAQRWYEKRYRSCLRIVDNCEERIRSFHRQLETY